jgi:hypothetical protein
MKTGTIMLNLIANQTEFKAIDYFENACSTCNKNIKRYKGQTSVVEMLTCPRH